MKHLHERTGRLAKDAVTGLQVAIRAIREIYYLDQHHQEVPKPHLLSGYGGMLEDLDMFESILRKLAEDPRPPQRPEDEEAPA